MSISSRSVLAWAPSAECVACGREAREAARWDIHTRIHTYIHTYIHWAIGGILLKGYCWGPPIHWNRTLFSEQWTCMCKLAVQWHIGRQNNDKHSSVAKAMLNTMSSQLAHEHVRNTWPKWMYLHLCVNIPASVQNPKMHPLEKAQECTPQPPRKGSNNNPVRLKQFSRWNSEHY